MYHIEHYTNLDKLENNKHFENNLELYFKTYTLYKMESNNIDTSNRLFMSQFGLVTQVMVQSSQIKHLSQNSKPILWFYLLWYKKKLLLIIHTKLSNTSPYYMRLSTKEYILMWLNLNLNQNMFFMNTSCTRLLLISLKMRILENDHLFMMIKIFIYHNTLKTVTIITDIIPNRRARSYRRPSSF